MQENERKIIFKSKEHKGFYETNIEKVTCPDCYHKALIYAIGISEITRNHFSEIYSYEKDCILRNCLRSAWVTGSTIKLLRLAFNLYTDRTVEAAKDDRLYSVFEIFSNYEFAPFFMQAVLLRFQYIEVELVGGIMG